MIIELINEATAHGARQGAACEVMGLDPRTVQRWRKSTSSTDLRDGPKTRPKSALSEQERADILKIANSPEYRSKSPKQIVPLLAGRGVYLASEATFYRLLRAKGQVKQRERSRAPEHRHRPAEYMSTGPNQVWSRGHYIPKDFRERRFLLPIFGT